MTRLADPIPPAPHVAARLRAELAGMIAARDHADAQFDLQLDLAWPDDERAAAAADRWAERSVALDHRIRRLEALLAAVEQQAVAVPA